MFQIFDLEVAATGLDERDAIEAGFHPVSTLIWGNAIAGSMPGNKKLGLKLIADRATGKLLGAQAVGEMGAVSRINTLSAALWRAHPRRCRLDGSGLRAAVRRFLGPDPHCRPGVAATDLKKKAAL